AYAEYALALEEQVHPLPAKISFSQGAGVWVPYGTAYHALFHSAKAHASETVLVHGVSGGVGSAGVQMARAMGLTVLGTAGTQRGLDLVKREGAHQVFDHSKAGYQEEIMKATGGRGVDIILEMLANVNLAHDLKLLAVRGRVIVIGNRGEVTINVRELMGRRGSIRAFTLLTIPPGCRTRKRPNFPYNHASSETAKQRDESCTGSLSCTPPSHSRFFSRTRARSAVTFI